MLDTVQLVAKGPGNNLPDLSQTPNEGPTKSLKETQVKQVSQAAIVEETQDTNSNCED